MALFWQITVFLIIAAALGFVIGWLLRSARLESERPAATPRQSSDQTALADERDRLRTELRAARDAHAQLEASLAETQKLADARAGRVRELEAAEASGNQRIARLEDELARAREGADRNERSERTMPPSAPQEPPAPADDIEGTPPQGLPAPEGEPDDLKKISGIGPSTEKMLHGLGIYHFHQIAEFTPDNVAWINQRSNFKGRIEREDWVGQAKQLAAG